MKLSSEQRSALGAFAVGGIAAVLIFIVPDVLAQHRCEARGGVVQHHFVSTGKTAVDAWSCFVPAPTTWVPAMP
jgi:hypothetical protein